MLQQMIGSHYVQLTALRQLEITTQQSIEKLPPLTKRQQSSALNTSAYCTQAQCSFAISDI